MIRVSALTRVVRRGCWTVGVSLSGNEAGVTPDQLVGMSEEQKKELRQKASEALRKHRPHYIIDTVVDLIPVLEEIELRMKKGERPIGQSA